MEIKTETEEDIKQKLHDKNLLDFAKLIGAHSGLTFRLLAKDLLSADANKIKYHEKSMEKKAKYNWCLRKTFQGTSKNYSIRGTALFRRTVWEKGNRILEIEQSIGKLPQSCNKFS